MFGALKGSKTTTLIQKHQSEYFRYKLHTQVTVLLSEIFLLTEVDPDRESSGPHCPPSPRSVSPKGTKQKRQREAREDKYN